MKDSNFRPRNLFSVSHAGVQSQALKESKVSTEGYV